MPNVTKENQTLVIEKVSTEKGEITINLNLNIQLDGGNIQVNASATPEEKKIEERKEFIPEAEFDLEIPLVSGFGKKI